MKEHNVKIVSRYSQKSRSNYFVLVDTVELPDGTITAIEYFMTRDQLSIYQILGYPVIEE